MKTLARSRDRAEILQRLKAVRPESARRWGRMSAHQMVCHLSDSFLVVTGQKPVSHSTSLLQRTIVKWMALYLPLPWPAGIPTRPEVDQELGGTRPVDFARDVAQLEALLAHITTQTRPFDSQLHPIFGKMSESAWLRWSYLHVDHHLRQFGA
jgi:hypothetical protein